MDDETQLKTRSTRVAIAIASTLWILFVVIAILALLAFSAYREAKIWGVH